MSFDLSRSDSDSARLAPIDGISSTAAPYWRKVERSWLDEHDRTAQGDASKFDATEMFRRLIGDPVIKSLYID